MSDTKDLANGKGFIYKTDTSGSTPLQIWENNSFGVEEARRDGLTEGPLAGNIAAFGKIEVTSAKNAGSDEVTNVTVNGIKQIGSNVSITDGDKEQTAQDIRDEINNHAASGHDYTATTDGAEIYLHGPVEDPESVNGHTVSISWGGKSIFDTTDVGNGNDGDGIYDPVSGSRYYYDADFGPTGCSGEGTATRNDLSNSKEITKYIINRGLQQSIPRKRDIQLSDGTLTVERESSLMEVQMDSEGGSGNDTLTTINTSGFFFGDRMLLTAKNESRDITIDSASITNVYLTEDNNFVSKGGRRAIEFVYDTTDASGEGWYEVGRSSSTPLNVSDLRDQGFAIGVGGVGSTTLPTSGTVTFTPGTDERIQKIKGNIDLVGDLDVSMDTTAAIEGDEFYLAFEASITVRDYKFSIQEKDLSDDHALHADFVAYAYYDGDSWIWSLLPNMRNGTAEIAFEGFKINTKDLLDSSISTAKIASNAVTNGKLASTSVATGNLQNASVTAAKLASGSVTHAKLGSSAKKEVFTILVSFEAEEQNKNQVRMSYPGKVTNMFASVVKAIAGTDAATIQARNGSDTNMTDGSISLPASTAQDVSAEASPSANNAFGDGDILEFEGSKSTAGGKALLTVEVERT